MLLYDSAGLDFFGPEVFSSSVLIWHNAIGQNKKVHNFLSWNELRAKCYHLYHDKEQPETKWYQRNLDILNKTSQMDKAQLQKVIFNQLPKIGMKNKYDNFI